MISQNKIPGKSRGVSPVIATVILVAVAITVAVAVSYWMAGISSQYTSFEKVEITQAVCSWDGTAGEWTTEIKLKNTGTKTATLISMFVNEIEVDLYGQSAAAATQAATSMTETENIESGATVMIYLYIDGIEDAAPDGQWQSVSSGTTINIKIHSAGGMDYIKLVQLT